MCRQPRCLEEIYGFHYPIDLDSKLIFQPAFGGRKLVGGTPTDTPEHRWVANPASLLATECWTPSVRDRLERPSHLAPGWIGVTPLPQDAHSVPPPNPGYRNEALAGRGLSRGQRRGGDRARGILRLGDQLRRSVNISVRRRNCVYSDPPPFQIPSPTLKLGKAFETWAGDI